MPLYLLSAADFNQVKGFQRVVIGSSLSIIIFQSDPNTFNIWNTVEWLYVYIQDIEIGKIIYISNSLYTYLSLYTYIYIYMSKSKFIRWKICYIWYMYIVYIIYVYMTYISAYKLALWHETLKSWRSLYWNIQFEQYCRQGIPCF